MFVAEVNVMDSIDHFNNIKKITAFKEVILSSGKLSLQEMAQINERTILLINSLNFWLAHGNMNRYIYDLNCFFGINK
jgi:hypothetical protein